jgi:hypothetical protein
MLSPQEKAATVRSIAAVQRRDGAIPWYPGGRWDPWDHVECALALDAGGAHDAALHAFRFLAARQRHDGSWACPIVGGREQDEVLEANGAAYIAVGVWHRFLTRGEEGTLHELWPTVQKAIDFALDLQRPDGTIAWARSLAGAAGDHALLTGCASIVTSVRCALAIAHELGGERPDWELSLGALANALRARPDAFADRSRYSMDWYYPILSGVLDRDAAADRVEEGWGEFVVEGLGARCVNDRPWITSAETAELAIALSGCGFEEEAHALFSWVQYLRHDDGSYWTGATYPDGRHFPDEKTTWSGAANVLASDVLSGASPATDLFTGASLPPIPDLVEGVLGIDSPF